MLGALVTKEVQSIDRIAASFRGEIELSKQEIRDSIASVESFALKQEQVEIPLVHHFSKGVYAREITVPEGSLIVGKIHKHQSMSIMSKGEMSIMSIEGIVRVKAPYTVVSEPGIKRLAYAHEETVWTSIHGTDETDVEKLEADLVTLSYDEVPQIENSKMEGEPCPS